MGALLPTIAGQPPSAVPNPSRDKLEDCSWERALRDRRDRAGCRSGPHRKRDNRSCRQDFEEGHWSSSKFSSRLALRDQHQDRGADIASHEDADEGGGERKAVLERKDLGGIGGAENFVMVVSLY